MVKGQVISGEFGKIVVRQKSDEKLELGELLIAKTLHGKILLQVYDLLYGSQISQQNLELISGLRLEENTDLEFLEPKLKNYNIALIKPMIFIKDNMASLCKTLPTFFSEVFEVKNEDLTFLTKPNNALFLGNLRSGSKMLDTEIYLPGKDVFSHHILIAATTGRGKSNLCSVLLWDAADKDYCGILVLDPHDEYYGRNKLGLKDKGNVVYYTSQNVPPGGKTLKINIRNLKPHHLNGATYWSDPQQQALSAYYKKYGQNWVEAIILEKRLDVMFNELTFGVVRRKILSLLNLDFQNRQLFCNGIFDISGGENTINDICNELEQSKTVIIDTSNFSGAVEILVGSMVANEIYSKYKYYKKQGSLDTKPVISVVLEEAPRVLGKEVLEKGSNIFSTIAREGRKFKVGLTAITQLPSLIPRQILANMNTKIILGIEMSSERQAIIESASQDLSTDNRNIAALDKGEAIITSNFARFATPVKIPLFSTFAKPKEKYESKFSGVNLT